MARKVPTAPRRANTQSKTTGQRTQGVRWHEVNEDQDGQRVDNFLLAQFRDVPKSVVYRIIRKGEVRVNKGRVKPDTRLAMGDVVRIPPMVRKPAVEKAQPGQRIQAVMEKAVLFENEHMLVVNKPSGIAVHGGSGVDFGLIEVLRAARPSGRFLELVHRLDRDTSGLVMVAKKRSALKHLQEQLKRKQITKTYHALVTGVWSEAVSRIDQPLLRFELANGERRVRVDDEGKASLTRFALLRAYQGYSLVEAMPVTGRTHQIRVHCAFAGHPIAGDEKYMDTAGLSAFKATGGTRLMLHARELEFSEPGSGEIMKLQAEYDEAFESMLTRLAARTA